jgi:hypothetical protein
MFSCFSMVKTLPGVMVSQVLARMAEPQMKRQRFPELFTLADDMLEEEVSGLEEDQKATFIDKRKRPEEWQCVPHKSILAAADAQKEGIISTLHEQHTTTLWMTGADRVGLIALLINADPKLPAFVRPQGRHTLPALVYEMLSVVQPAYYNTSDINLFPLNKHHLNNGGMLASLLGHADYKVGQHPAQTPVAPVAGLGAIFAILCRAIRLHTARAAYFDGLLTAAMEHLLNIFDCVRRDQVPQKLEMFPAIKGSATLRDAHTLCLQHNYIPLKELERDAAMLIQVFRADAWADDMTAEAIDRGLWLQRLFMNAANPDTVIQGACLRPDPAKFSWQSHRCRPLSFADAEVLLMRHAHVHGLQRVRMMRETEHKRQSPFPLVFVELKDIHAGNLVQSLEKVMTRGRFYITTYLSDTDGFYNTLVAMPSNLWAAYQSFTTMRSLLASTKTEGRDVTRLPFAPLLFQLFTTEFGTRDDDGTRVAYSILGSWLGAGDIDPVRICNDSEAPTRGNPTKPFYFGKLKQNQDALRYLFGATVEELKTDQTAEDRWSNLVLTAKALVLAILKPGLGVHTQWEELADLVERGYHEHKRYLPIAKSIIAATTSDRPPVVPEEKASAPDQTYEDWYPFQRKVLRPRVDATQEGGCNHSKGCGESMFRFLVQMEMESLHYGATRIESTMRQHILPRVDGDAIMSHDKVTTASHVYHGCLSMFDPAVAWVLPDASLMFGTSAHQVFVWRRAYDQYYDLSDTYRWFEWCFLERIDPQMFVRYNQCGGKPKGKAVALLSPTSAKRARGQAFTLPASASASKGKEAKSKGKEVKGPANQEEEATHLMVGLSRSMHHLTGKTTGKEAKQEEPNAKKARMSPEYNPTSPAYAREEYSPSSSPQYSPGETYNPAYDPSKGAYSVTSPSP